MSAIPLGMWNVTTLFLTIIPFLLAPYWASFCRSESDPRRALDEFYFDQAGSNPLGAFDLNATLRFTSDDEVGAYGCFSSYLLATIAAMCMHTFRAVLSGMADPFGGEEDDDIKWDVWRNEIDRGCMPAAPTP